MRSLLAARCATTWLPNDGELPAIGGGALSALGVLSALALGAGGGALSAVEGARDSVRGAEATGGLVSVRVLAVSRRSDPAQPTTTIAASAAATAAVMPVRK